MSYKIIREFHTVLALLTLYAYHRLTVIRSTHPIMNIKSLLAAAILATGLASQLNAAALTLNSPGVVGVWDDRSNASDATRLAAAQKLLDLDKNTGVLYVDAYVTSSTEYSGDLTGGLKMDYSEFGESYKLVTGYEWAFAKYDGPNAGYVLFYLGGVAAGDLVPTFPADLWTNKQQYGMSGVTFYNGSSVPDGGTTAVLLGLALVGMSFVARRRVTS